MEKSTFSLPVDPKLKTQIISDYTPFLIDPTNNYIEAQIKVPKDVVITIYKDKAVFQGKLAKETYLHYLYESSPQIKLFDDDFTEVCTRAMTNNPVAQDLVAYFYNRGVPGHLQPNYELYMSWEILAGANGNEFAIDKLEFFINPVLDQIVGNEEIIATALRHRNITKDNALYVISNLICEGMADELKLDPKKLIKVQNDKPSR